MEKEPQVGVVTFLDVLGWKGVYDRQENAIESLKELVDGVRGQAKEKRGRVNRDTVVKSISDTIAIFTACSERETLDAIEIHGELCQWLIPKSIDVTLPVRGATAYGEFEVNDNIFVGKAVDEAASWHEQGNWIGVHLTPSADFIFSRHAKSSAWVKYLAPIKAEMKWSPYCVNWFSAESKAEALRGRQLLLDKFRSMGPITPEIAPKFINTQFFVDAMTNMLLQDRKGWSKFLRARTPYSSE